MSDTILSEIDLVRWSIDQCKRNLRRLDEDWRTREPRGSELRLRSRLLEDLARHQERLARLENNAASH